MPNDHEGSMLVEQEQIALQSILARLGTNGRGDLLPVLLEAQSILGYLPEPMVAEIGLDMRIPQAEIFGVIEFYSMLYSEPMCREVLRVCASPMCAVQGGLDHYRKLQPMQSEAGGEIFAHRSLEAATCLGLCDHAPAALNGSQAVSIQPVQDHGEATFDLKPVPASFVDGSPRWLTQRMGMDPTDIQAYQSKGGFSGLRRAIEEIAPAEVIQEIKISGLSGRGGAAFPTGLKWELTASSDDPERFLVCNADESEPGTFKDRLLLEGDPYSVIEGMILAAYAIQACRGYLFVRGEYPNAQSILTEAIHNAREGGFLGDKVLGSEFSFDIELRSGAGAYICGEETALFEAIEGRRGYPRLKPPFPTTHGLFGKPTVINNVETLAAVSWIVANGSKAFRAVGTADSPGTKLFCLSGDVQQPGVYEVPFGITLADLMDLAGGVQGELKGVLLGGAAGSFASSEHLRLPLSFEDLRSAGLSLGSGVLFVINQSRDMRVILKSLAEFFAHESCGKCYPCQLGTQRQLEIIDRWAEAKTTDADNDALKDVVYTMNQGSICGLGMTAGTAIESAFELWPDLWAVPSPTHSKGVDPDE